MGFLANSETVDVSQTTFSETIAYKVNKSDLSIQVIDMSNEAPIIQAKCIDAKPGQSRSSLLDYCDSPMTKAQRAELSMYQRCNARGVRYLCQKTRRGAV